MRLLILLLFPLFTLAQRTYVPDDAFEQALINFDLDDILDDSVNTSAIDTVQALYISDALGVAKIFFSGTINITLISLSVISVSAVAFSRFRARKTVDRAQK